MSAPIKTGDNWIHRRKTMRQRGPRACQANPRAGMEARGFETECHFRLGEDKKCAAFQAINCRGRQLVRQPGGADRVQLACRRSVLAMFQPNSLRTMQPFGHRICISLLWPFQSTVDSSNLTSKAPRAHAHPPFVSCHPVGSSRSSFSHPTKLAGKSLLMLLCWQQTQQYWLHQWFDSVLSWPPNGQMAALLQDKPLITRYETNCRCEYL
jgi:hypothetical protein